MNNKKKLVIYTLIEVVSVFIICIVSGAFDWVGLTFSIDKLKDPMTWKNCLINTVAYSLALVVGTLLKLEKKELSDPIYQSSIERYLQLLKCKMTSFYYYIDTVFNRNTKKIFLEKSIQRKLDKLDKHANDEKRLSYYRYKKGELDISDKELTPKIKRYIKKRESLENMKDSAYIEESVDYLNVKYPKVQAHLFNENITGNMKNDVEAYKIQNTLGRDLPIKISRKMITTILSGLIVALMVFSPDANELLSQMNGWLKLLIKYLVRVSMIFVNFGVGVFTADKLFDSDFILPVNNRSRILTDYITWNKENNIEPTFADKLVESYENQKQLKEDLERQIMELENKKK